jgi:hypothetical protein
MESCIIGIIGIIIVLIAGAIWVFKGLNDAKKFESVGRVI